MKPILVTGSHRSGSTWVGNMLGLSSSIDIVSEPFNLLHSKDYFGLDFISYWFYYLTEKDINENFDKLSNIYGLSYTLADLTSNIKRIGFYQGKLGALKNFLLFSFNKKVLKRRTLIKDPLAFFSVEQLHKIFNLDVIMLIRHPAAFVSSIKRMNNVEEEWGYNFMFEWLDCKTFHPEVLNKYKEEIFELKDNKNWLDAAIILWKIFHDTIIYYQNTQKPWHFIRHEDLAKDTVKAFERLYAELSLPFNSKVAKKITELTGERNPIEVRGQKLHDFKRNSKESVTTWKNRLNDKEVQLIYDKTRSLSANFYSDQEW